MSQTSNRPIFFGAAVMVLFTGMGIGPLSCGTKGNQYSIPGAPTMKFAVAGNSGAQISFTAPSSDGGAAITSYTATSSPGGIKGSATSSPITVLGLTNGTAYTFTVTATNAAGTSAASAASNSVTPIAVPGAPTIGTATPGNESVSVTFTAPTNDGGSSITGYTVTSSPGGITGSGSASPITVSGLTDGTAYTFTVVATNGNGNSLASAASNSATPINGDVAVDIGGTAIYKLKATTGAIVWGPVSQANCGQVAVDQIDYGVYTGTSANCGSSGAAVFKFSGASGSQVWTATSVMNCGSCGDYYVGNGGIAVDSSSSEPGVVFTESGCFGNIGKVSRSDGSQLWCNGTDDLARPSINPSTGEIYAVTDAGAMYDYDTIYASTAAGAMTSGSTCEGLTEVNPADGTLYNGGGTGGANCGMNLSQMSTSSLGTANWTMSLSSDITSFDSIGIQPWSGGYVYVGSAAESEILVINPSNQTLVRTIPTTVPPTYMAVNPAAGTIYISDGASGKVYAYSAAGTLLWTSPDLSGTVVSVAAPRNVVGAQ